MAGGPVAIGLMVASQLMEAKGQSDQLNAGAAADRENARLAELGGAWREDEIRRRERAVSGEAISALAANGVSVGSGSAQDLLFQNMLEGQHAALNARYEAASEAYGLRRSAAAKKAQAKSALFGGMLRAGAAAVTGMDQLQGAASAEKAAAIVREARWPGAMKLPMPGPAQSRGWYIGGKYGIDL